MFDFKYIDNKKILCSDILAQTMAIHLFTTRESVVTAKDIEELKDLCKQNLKNLANYLSLDESNIIAPVQTHSDNISIAKKGMQYPNTDALVVEDKDIAILLNFADCTPIILYDDQKNIGAVVHAGWRGTAKSIVQKTINFMKNKYKTNPQDIIAIIGPAISMKNYQVDNDVYIKLMQTLKKDYDDTAIYDTQNNKYNIDLKSINKHQLEELGVRRIDNCNYCTYDFVDTFFSYRKENGKTARHSAVLKLIK